MLIPFLSLYDPAVNCRGRRYAPSFYVDVSASHHISSILWTSFFFPPWPSHFQFLLLFISVDLAWLSTYPSLVASGYPNTRPSHPNTRPSLHVQLSVVSLADYLGLLYHSQINDDGGSPINDRMILRDFIFRYQYFILPTAFQVVSSERAIIVTRQFCRGMPAPGVYRSVIPSYLVEFLHAVNYVLFIIHEEDIRYKYL